MVMPNFAFAAGEAVAPAVTAIATNNAAWRVTDLAGTYVQDAGKIRLTRSTSDGQGFEHCAPGARVRIGVTLASTGMVAVSIQYTGLVTRTDTYRPIGEVWVDGAASTTFTGPSKALPSTPHPTGTTTAYVVLSAGTHDLDIIFPYCASIDVTGLAIPATASVAAPTARTTAKAVFFGDSITHGFNTDAPSEGWPFKIARTKGKQLVNHGYGGRGMTSADATTAGSYGGDFAAYLIGFNNFYPGGTSLVTWKADYKTAITNFRTASTTAGKATAKLYCITPTWSNSDADVGTGPYAANSPTLEQFRQAIRDAITEVADAYTVLIEGRGAGMPTGTGNFADGIHPGATAAATIASIVGSQIL